MEDNGALQEPIPPEEQGGFKHVSKRRFTAHVRRAYEEAAQTRDVLERNVEAIDELREATIAAGQDASMEREESHGVLQTISRGIAELTKTVADLANTMRGSRPAAADTGGARSYFPRRENRGGHEAGCFPTGGGQGFRSGPGEHAFGNLGGARSVHRVERYGGLSGVDGEYD